MLKHFKVMGFSIDGIVLLDENVMEKKVKQKAFLEFGISTEENIHKEFISEMGKNCY